MQQDQWHYKDDRNGKRLGPVDRDEVSKLVSAERIDRATLVWNPAMPEWAKASTTDLASLFSEAPPPLPASEISRWAVYALALFPLWGLLIQAAACVAFSDRAGLTPQAMFDHRAWLLFYILGNATLGGLDERNLEKGGLAVRGAAVVAAFLVPVYVFASCRTFNRHAERRTWLAYLPFVLWLAAFAGSIFVGTLIFDPDAPLIFRPDAWF